MSEKPEHIGIDSKSTAERDRIDLNHEISGVSTGRIQRFLSEDYHDIYGESEKKKSERHYHSMLEILLAEDAQYFAFYSQVTENLDKAYQAVGQALIDINQRLGVSGRKLQFLRENTAESEDGTKIFRSNDGSIYTEDGKHLNDDEAQKYRLLDNLQSWEEYKAAKEVYEAAARQKTAAETYQHDVLDHARERLNDEDNPPTMDELKEIQLNIQAKKPEVLTKYFYKTGLLELDNPQQSAAQDISATPTLNTPAINSHFNQARLDLPDIETLTKITEDKTAAPAI
ncbi:MAG: hypothetical protein L3J26_06795 [Candidatus Polarisedimenticolaceae bacterium]|nr:hypothetical protein [Candidatus Polarisedimenticolaceae bacterium]